MVPDSCFALAHAPHQSLNKKPTKLTLARWCQSASFSSAYGAARVWTCCCKAYAITLRLSRKILRSIHKKLHATTNERPRTLPVGSSYAQEKSCKVNELPVGSSLFARRFMQQRTMPVGTSSCTRKFMQSERTASGELIIHKKIHATTN